MAKLLARKKAKNKRRSPTWLFETRKTRGEPERDTPEVRAEKDRLIAEFQAKREGK